MSEVMQIISLCSAIDNCRTFFSWTKIINKCIATPLAIITPSLFDNAATNDFFTSANQIVLSGRTHGAFFVKVNLEPNYLPEFTKEGMEASFEIIYKPPK